MRFRLGNSQRRYDDSVKSLHGCMLSVVYGRVGRIDVPTIFDIGLGRATHGITQTRHFLCYHTRRLGLVSFLSFRHLFSVVENDTERPCSVV